jgi:hypothetical protein
MNSAITEAIDEVRAAFPDTTVTCEEVAGGAWVTITPVDLGPRWTPQTSPLTFHIADAYPYADVYPHFLAPDVVRTDTGSYVEAVTPNASWNGHPALQVSRKSNKWSPAHDTAALKALRVVEWLRAQ